MVNRLNENGAAAVDAMVAPGHRVVRLVMMFGLLGAAGCGDSSACTTGMSIPCACDDGRSGAQTCQADGTYAMCTCGGGVDAGPGIDAGPDFDGGPDFDAGPELDGGMDAAVGSDGGGPESGTDAGPIEGFIHVSSGWGTTCATHSDGRAWCWGAAITERGPDCTAVGAPSMLLSDALATHRSASLHGCAIRGAGLVACWGDNRYGQLGDGTMMDRTSPVLVSSLSGIVGVGVGSGHSCSLDSAGLVQCWGRNNDFQLGNSGVAQSSAPIPVAGLSGGVELAVGGLHACVRRGSGTVACWGTGRSGQLGNGLGMRSATPVEVTGITDAIDIDTGNSASCAVHATGGISCWGDNGNGKLGNPAARATERTPIDVIGVTDAVRVSIANGHACAVLRSGEVMCWGDNRRGQLGDGGLTSRVTPALVPGITNATTVSAMTGHTCVTTATGEVRCWGTNNCGEIGDGTRSDAISPTTVSVVP